MTEHRRTVVFSAPGAESEEPEKDGQDIATTIRQALQAQGIQADEPDKEDYGWFVTFEVAGESHWFLVGRKPADAEEPSVWIGTVERPSLLGLILGRQKRVSPEALRAVDSAVRAVPGVARLRWYRDKDFRAGRDETASAGPLDP